jgi:hypothetical protein
VRVTPVRIVAVFGVIVVVAVGFVGARYYLAHRDLRFDRAAWIRAKPEGYCAKSGRGRMVDDLVHNRLRAGMSMASVRGLLGAPDDNSDGVWSYGVDREDEVFLPTCVYLELQTRAGRLQHAGIYRDS